MNQPITEQQEKFSSYRTSINRWGQETKIPVIDVRDGIVERMIANQMVKANNRSAYIAYTEYHKPKINNSNDLRM
jgi:hypothetical protein